ncbi:MAG: LytTR family transcriptional regulator [Hungatella sp.]|nr:LytTR family transcriptional regulator [Hungatella sp.]
MKVSLDKIRYFESSKRTIHLFMERDTYKFYGKLSEVEKNMERSKFSFLRIHQSHLVNYKYIKGIGYNFVELTDGNMLQMSKDRQKVDPA